MCKFFSVDSDGKGNIFFFTVEEVAQIMAEGNTKGYEFNSHTSIADKSGFKGEKEDKLNKWEYDPEKDELVADSLVVNDDREKVLEAIKKYLDGKNIPYIRNLYNRNSGDRNSGNWNSGNRNSGHRNSGDWNSGDWNSGNRNSGNRNSGDWNKESPLGSFCSKRKYYLFDQPVTEAQYRKIFNLDCSWFALNEWITESEISEEEKSNHPYYKVIGGYLKTYTYKEAWSKCPPEVLEQISKLPKFNAKVFEEISGIKIKKGK